MVDPYRNLSTKKELDLREELDRTFYGAQDEIAKKITGLLRVMRRDSNGDAIRCECRDSITDEADKDTYCPHCLGMGYLWNEIRINYYRNGEESNKNVIFYIEDNISVSIIDYLVTLKLDNEGNIIQPISRDSYYKIHEVIKFRSDNGRIEYVKLRTEYDPKWSVWYGVKLRGN
jgi:hypothetical protein